jgi:hypothetical protein
MKDVVSAIWISRFGIGVHIEESRRNAAAATVCRKSVGVSHPSIPAGTGTPLLVGAIGISKKDC